MFFPNRLVSGFYYLPILFFSLFVSPGQGFRLLGCMRMLDAGVDFQFGELSGAESGVGEHSFDRTLDDCRGTALSERFQGFLFETVRESGMPRINFLGFFLAGDFDFFGIDDDDEITRVNVGRELRLVFASQDVGDSGSQTAKGFAFGVYDEPFISDVAVFGEICLHERILQTILLRNCLTRAGCTFQRCFQRA